MYRGMLHGKAVCWNQVREDCVEGCLDVGKEKQRRVKKATQGASSKFSMKTDGLLPSQEGRVHFIYIYIDTCIYNIHSFSYFLVRFL